MTFLKINNLSIDYKMRKETVNAAKNINIDINKQFQNSDFGGELTPAQLKYCANDVIYLHQILQFVC